jgi:hypothetical protein
MENSTKSLCQPQDSDKFNFVNLLCFSSICASSSGDLVKVGHFNVSRTLSVTNVRFRHVEYGVAPSLLLGPLQQRRDRTKERSETFIASRHRRCAIFQ